MNFGDQRLGKRLLKIAKSLENKPEESICSAIGSFHDCKAAYRFFANSRVSPERIARAHIDQAIQRAKQVKESLLIIHDTTDLVYSKFKSIKDLGTITTKPGMAQGLKGIFLHNSLMLSESGVPLGIIKQSFFTFEDYLSARGQTQRNLQGSNKAYCIEKKASWRWIDHLKGTEKICNHLEKDVIHVADRESDIYEFLQVAKKLNTRYVIRSQSNRRIILEGESRCNTSTIGAELIKSSALGAQLI